jgi:chromosome segregation ATPase
MAADDTLLAIQARLTMIESNLSSIKDRMYEYHKNTAEYISQMFYYQFYDIVREIKGIQSAIITTLSNYLGGITDALKKIDDRLRLIDAKVTDLQEKINVLKEQVEFFNARLNVIMETLETFIKDFFYKMDEQLKSITNTIQQAYELQSDFIQSQIQIVNNNIDTTEKNIVQDIKTSASNVIDNVRISQDAIQKTVNQGVSSIITNATEQTTKVITEFHNELGAVASALDRFDSDLVNCLWSIYRDFKAWINTMINPDTEDANISYDFGNIINSNVLKHIGAKPNVELSIKENNEVLV